MTEKDMFEESFKRPSNYFKLSPQKQWDIDAALGILDWEGSGLSNLDRARFAQHYLDKKDK